MFMHNIHQSGGKGCHMEYMIWQARTQALPRGKKKLQCIFLKVFLKSISAQSIKLRVKITKVVFVGPSPTGAPSQPLSTSSAWLRGFLVRNMDKVSARGQIIEISQRDINSICAKKKGEECHCMISRNMGLG